MVVVVTLLILTVLILGFTKIYLMYKTKINFFIEGMNRGFSLSEVRTLWTCAEECELEDPVALFISMPSLTNCISRIKAESEETASPNLQNLLTKLYDFRTKIETEADKKRGLDSTRSLSAGQKIRIVLPGQGVFASEIVNNGREIVIGIPTKQGQITVGGHEWVGKTISVYLWRTGDAQYVFDTAVNHEGLFLGKPSLFLQHTSNLLRSQKRNAVRAKCHVSADLYILKEKPSDYSIVETKAGYKCILDDISEKGALVRIGGRGVPNIYIKLQFQIQGKLVVMFGIVRTVEYSEEKNQSRLHFECIHIDDVMRNHVLSYVYNILPQKDKELFDAMAYVDEDEKNDGAAGESGAASGGKSVPQPEDSSASETAENTGNGSAGTADDSFSDAGVNRTETEDDIPDKQHY